jgi:hypothetical protein
MQPFVEQELKAAYGDRWLETAQNCIRSSRESVQPQGEVLKWDAHVLLTIVWDQWNAVFRTKLGPLERSLISELREYRNRWAHQAAFTVDDAYRVLDSVERLLRVAHAEVEAADAARLKSDVLREQFREHLQGESQQIRRINRRGSLWIGYGIYALCAVAIIVQAFHAMGMKATALIAALVAVCTWFVLQKARPKPDRIGVHECPECGRVIYQDPCPYCVPAAAATNATMTAKSVFVSR